MYAMKAGWRIDAGPTSLAPSLPLSLCALVMVSSLILGGGTRGGFLSDTILQFLSIPPLLVAVWQLRRVPPGEMRESWLFRWGLGFCALLVAVPLMQLVPLPPPVWTMLPNRQTIVETFQHVGGDLPWMPISVSQEATWIGALSLMAPIAVFLSTLLLSYAERRVMSLLILAIGVVGAFLGLLQVAQGPSSPLRFFSFTNTNETVGFFANRNHFSALLYALILLAVCWTTDAVFRARASLNRKRYDHATVAAAVIGTAVIVVFLSAQAMARSRAGLALTILALVGAFALTSKKRRLMSGGAGRTVRLHVGAMVVIFWFVAEYTLYRIMERFATDPLADSRITFARNTFAAALDYLPFGSGTGSFTQVYGMYEQPGDTMVNAFANHAHSDILEVSLESGILGLALMGFFGVWVARGAMGIWRSARLGLREVDLLLARSATLIIVLLSLHSIVDYPLRTGAVMAIMAFSCGLLVAPSTQADITTSLRPDGEGRALSGRAMAPPAGSRRRRTGGR